MLAFEAPCGLAINQKQAGAELCQAQLLLKMVLGLAEHISLAWAWAEVDNLLE